MNAASQWTTIGWMIICGILMGTVFDIYRVSSHRFHVPRWLLPALDIVFWAAATLGVFSVLLDNNHGEVRMYVFMGLGIGITGYFGLLSYRVVRVTAWMLETLIRTAVWLMKMFRLLLLVPFMGIVRLLAKLLDILFIVTAAVLIGVLRLLWIPLRPLARYVWARLLPLRRKLGNGADAGKRVFRRIRAAWDHFRKKT